MLSKLRLLVAGSFITALSTRAVSLGELLHQSQLQSQSLAQTVNPVQQDDPLLILAQIQAKIESLSKMRLSEMVAAQTDSSVSRAKAMSTPPPPIEVPPPETNDEIHKGLMEIAEQLTDMADSLPLIKQCMNDVKSGYYNTQTHARINAGGVVDAQLDPISGQVVQITLDPTTQAPKVEETEEVDAHHVSGESSMGNGDTLYDDGDSPYDAAQRKKLKKIIIEDQGNKAAKKPAKDPPAEKDAAAADKKGDEKKEGDKKGDEKKDGKEGDQKEGDKKEEKKEDKKEEKKDEKAASQTDSQVINDPLPADPVPEVAAETDADAALAAVTDAEVDITSDAIPAATEEPKTEGAAQSDAVAAADPAAQQQAETDAQPEVAPETPAE